MWFMDNKYTNETAKLIKFIEDSPTPFHTVKNIKDELLSHGYTELSESKEWIIEQGKKYFVIRNGSSIIAFAVPNCEFKNILICAAHSDSPCFKIKPNAQHEASGCYTKLNCEKYGGMIYSTWLDRPLSIAGRVVCSTAKGIKSYLVNLKDESCVIPNLAVHMQRDINNGYIYNLQTDMLPLIGNQTYKDEFINKITENINIPADSIIDYDLYLYNKECGTIWGDKEYFSAPRIDDLQCVYAAKEAFINSENANAINVLAVFDNEEVGSLTKQGARSTFAHDTLTRIKEALGMSDSAFIKTIASSYMVSADNAHAVHPNHAEKADITSQPKMNRGIVIKYNANQQYTTDSVSAAIFKRILKNADIPYQEFANRSDIPGGSTLGNLLNQQISLNTIDIGAAQLAMHSAYETAGGKDTSYLIDGLKAFYKANLTPVSDGEYEIL